MWMQGQEMMEGGHMLGGAPGMMVFGLFYLLILIGFFWLLFRLVEAVEEIAENTNDSKDD